jgi:glycosyltransferase involved in cell wall biosynthesis
MAQGVPVVSTAVLGTRSILKDGCGGVVAPENRHDFAAAVVRVLESPGLRAELAAAGRVYARTWSSAAMAARLRQVYESLVRAPQAGKA